VDRLGREVSGAELEGHVLARIHRAHQALAASGIRDREPRRDRPLPRQLLRDGKLVEIAGEGNGRSPRSFTDSKAGVPRFEITNYSEHALALRESFGHRLHTNQARRRPITLGRGVDTNIELASVAPCSAR